MLELLRTSIPSLIRAQLRLKHPMLLAIFVSIVVSGLASFAAWNGWRHNRPDPSIDLGDTMDSSHSTASPIQDPTAVDRPETAILEDPIVCGTTDGHIARVMRQRDPRECPLLDFQGFPRDPELVELNMLSMLEDERYNGRFHWEC